MKRNIYTVGDIRETQFILWSLVGQTILIKGLKVLENLNIHSSNLDKKKNSKICH